MMKGVLSAYRVTVRAAVDTDCSQRTAVPGGLPHLFQTTVCTAHRWIKLCVVDVNQQLDLCPEGRSIWQVTNILHFKVGIIIVDNARGPPRTTSVYRAQLPQLHISGSPAADTTSATTTGTQRSTIVRTTCNTKLGPSQTSPTSAEEQFDIQRHRGTPNVLRAAKTEEKTQSDAETGLRISTHLVMETDTAIQKWRSTSILVNFLPIMTSF